MYDRMEHKLCTNLQKRLPPSEWSVKGISPPFDHKQNRESQGEMIKRETSRKSLSSLD